jgi:thymidylate synthase
MRQYHDALRQIYQDGIDRGDRTGVGTRSLFGLQMRFDLQEGFPAVTTKKLAWKAVVSELLWFLEGSDDERRLAEIHYGKPREELIGKTTIWTANADAQGKALGYSNTDDLKLLGPVYGAQWRCWIDPDGNTIDQIENLINGIKNDPNGRRHILSAWNVGEIDVMALPPCHCFAQFFVHNGKLSCQMYQRSADMFLGVPFNIASYALLTHMIAQVCDLDVGELIMTFGDAHIYKNHFEQVKTQLEREPYKLPTLWLNPNIDNIDYFDMEHIALNNYVSHDTIKAPMAV